MTLIVLALTALSLFWGGTASAYPWMIRHPYSGCVPCHADPTGSGLLTPYGRALSEQVLRTRYGKVSPEDQGELGQFMWNAVTLPDWLLMGASFRNLVAGTVQPSPATAHFYQMQADAKAQITLSRFRASGTLGWVHEGGRTSAITHADTDNLVSREHWLGLDIGEDKEWLLRAGRLNLPFGVRQVEHTMWTRTSTRTDIDSTAQHGVALAYSGKPVRGELMAILGNYQLNPDAYRERGYRAFGEWGITDQFALGVSSLMTYAARDLNSGLETLRQAHGVSVRWCPTELLVLMAEGDALIRLPKDLGTLVGYATFLQADIEPKQGFHVIVTGESRLDGALGTNPEFGGWFGLNWFFAPHFDVRADFIDRATYDGVTQTYSNGITILGQMHMFL